MEKTVLSISAWVLFLGGLFGFAMGMVAFLGGKSPAEYGVMGIGGGAYLVGSAAVMFIKNRMK